MRKMKNKDNTKAELLKELKILQEEREKGMFKDITKLKQTEQAIQESENRLRELFNHMSSGVAIYEAKDNGRDFIFKDFNHAAEKIEKVKKDDIIGKSILQVFSGVKDFGLFQIFQEVYKSGKSQKYPISFYKDKRITGWRENYIYKLPSGEIAAVYDDITERKQAEEALKKSEEKYRYLFESSKDGIAFSDMEGNLLNANQAFLDMLGYRIDEIRRFTYKKLLPEKWQNDIISNQLMLRGYSDERELEFIKKNGAVFPASIRVWMIRSEQGKPVGMWAIARDITEQKKAEEALQESEEKYRALYDNAPLSYQSLNKDGSFRDVNPAWLKTLGYDRKEVIGKRYADFLHPNWKEYFEKSFPEFKRCGYVHDVQFKIRHKDGHYLDISFEGYIGYNPDGSFKQTYCVFQDITKRKKAEKVLQEAHDQLEDKVAQRTEELQNANLKLKELDRLKSMFIASMSHELRTPLSFIIGFSDIMLKEISGEINQEQRRQLTLVKNHANHLLGLINDAINVNKIDAGKVEMAIEEFDLPALSREIKDSFFLTTDKKGQKLSLEIPRTLLIESDRRRIKQILVNLMSNAIKFTARGEIKIKVIPKETTVEVSVRDNGIGIKKENMDKLFKSFSQIPNPGRIEEGTGLGLYLSKKNANLLGGDIIAESEWGKGSVFTLTLPLKYKEDKV